MHDGHRTDGGDTMTLIYALQNKLFHLDTFIWLSVNGIRYSNTVFQTYSFSYQGHLLSDDETD